MDPVLGPNDVEPRFTDLWKTGRVLNNTVLRASRWLPEGAGDWRVSPGGADLLKYRGPAKFFSDHTGHVFQVESLEPPDVNAGEPIWKHPKLKNSSVLLRDVRFVTEDFQSWCASSVECDSWACRILGRCGG